jgi:hypothetical protein
MSRAGTRIDETDHEDKGSLERRQSTIAEVEEMEAGVVRAAGCGAVYSGSRRWRSMIQSAGSAGWSAGDG